MFTYFTRNALDYIEKKKHSNCRWHSGFIHQWDQGETFPDYIQVRGLPSEKQGAQTTDKSPM